jgi:hypothetical protein
LERETGIQGYSIYLPPLFYDSLIRDISAERWLTLFQKYPTVKGVVLEGFSSRPEKVARLLGHPQIIARLRKHLKENPKILDAVLKEWSEEQIATVSFLDMIDHDFFLENANAVKNLLGPARLVAGFYILELLEDPQIAGEIDEKFWERKVDESALEPLVPLWSLLHDLFAQIPDARRWLESMTGSIRTAEAPPPPSEEEPGSKRREEHVVKKLSQKLQKYKAEATQLLEQLERCRSEREELRKASSEMEKNFRNRIDQALAQKHSEWFYRYRDVDLAPFEEGKDRIESLLKRAERAMELQRQADEQYGLISGVRQDLLNIERTLSEIEKIHSGSLVVHGEVEKVKELLLAERERILQLPGIERVMLQETPNLRVSDLRQKIRLLNAVPSNLPVLNQVQRILSQLASLGFVEDFESMQDDIKHKKRQVLEVLYDRFKPSRNAHEGKLAGSLEELVQTGQSREFDVYIDGYNILLKVQGTEDAHLARSLSDLREQFIAAVSEKTRLFRKITLVFDGVEESSDRRGNLEILFTDKTRGMTADAAIMQIMQRHKGSRALLVTADQEIIRAADSHVALVDPHTFYLFVFDLAFGNYHLDKTE